MGRVSGRRIGVPYTALNAPARLTRSMASTAGCAGMDLTLGSWPDKTERFLDTPS
jgi:hypothetical protein